MQFPVELCVARQRIHEIRLGTGIPRTLVIRLSTICPGFRTVSEELIEPAVRWTDEQENCYQLPWLWLLMQSGYSTVSPQNIGNSVEKTWRTLHY